VSAERQSISKTIIIGPPRSFSRYLASVGILKMISPFEYVIVLISIILGMGITQIVSGLASIIHRWEKVNIYWPHLLLVILVFLIHIQEWWAAYDMRNYEYWRLPTFLFIILYPVNLYILARILFPISWRGKVIDLKEFYYQHYKRIFLFTITLDILGIVDNVFISGYKMSDQVVQFIVLGILIFATLKANRNEVVHKAIAASLMIIFIVTLILAWNIFLIPGH
jgi:hypothetical protein